MFLSTEVCTQSPAPALALDGILVPTSVLLCQFLYQILHPRRSAPKVLHQPLRLADFWCRPPYFFVNSCIRSFVHGALHPKSCINPRSWRNFGADLRTSLSIPVSDPSSTELCSQSPAPTLALGGLLVPTSVLLCQFLYQILRFFILAIPINLN